MKQRYESGYSILLYYSWITDGWLVLLVWQRLRYRALCHVTLADRKGKSTLLRVHLLRLPVTAPCGLHARQSHQRQSPLEHYSVLVICHHMDQTHGTPPGGTRVRPECYRRSMST